MSEHLNFISSLYVMIITQSDFHSNPFSGFNFPLVSWVRCGTWLYRFLIFAPLLTFMHTPCLKSPLLWVILLCPDLCPIIIIIPISHPFVMHLIIQMFNTSVITLHIIRSVFKPQFIHCTKYAKYAFLLLFSILRTDATVWSDTICSSFPIKCWPV